MSYASVTYANVTEKDGGEVPEAILGDSRCQNLDVPVVPLFRLKIHKNIYFSASAGSRLL